MPDPELLQACADLIHGPLDLSSLPTRLRGDPSDDNPNVVRHYQSARWDSHAIAHGTYYTFTIEGPRLSL